MEMYLRECCKCLDVIRVMAKCIFEGIRGLLGLMECFGKIAHMNPGVLVCLGEFGNESHWEVKRNTGTGNVAGGA
jgi:hypothetical protein